MAQVRHTQTNFTAGEVSPLLYGRVDIDRYPNGAEEIFNGLILPHGGVARRPGSYYVAAAKSGVVACRLRHFRVSAFTSYVVEFGNEYARFYSNRGQVESGGNPVEVTLPYQTADLPELRFAQSGDILFITHNSYPPRIIRRTAVDAFDTQEIVFKNGPWEAENTTDITLTPSLANTVGTVTITASDSLFAATDVGRMIALYDKAQERQSSTSYGKGAVFYSDDRGVRRVWRVVKAGTTAAFDDSNTTPEYDLNGPTDEGDYIEDGTARLQYLGRGKSCWGWGIITSYLSATQVQIEVTDAFSGGIGSAEYSQDNRKRWRDSPPESTTFPSTEGTTRWKLGAWCEENGYPGTVCFFQQRTWWGGNTATPQTIWSSQSGDFYNMAPTEPDGIVIDTNAIVYAMDDDETNQILWMLPTWKGIAIGTASGEHLLSASSAAQQAVTPTNVYIRRASDRGSGQLVPAVRSGGASMFVQRGGRKLREMSYDIAQDSYTTPPASLISEHITGAGIVDLAVQEEPEGTIWIAREDGLLATLTYDAEQQVRGWGRHQIAGGEVESVAVVPSPDGISDDVYMAVKRAIDGNTVRYIEVVRAPYRSIIDGDDGGFFVDCGLTYDGAPATTFTGLDHLEGETVQICADGAYRGTAVVSGGEVTIEGAAASVVHIGLAYEMRVTPLPIEAGAQSGTAQGAMKKTTDCFVRLFESRGGEIGVDGVYTRIQQRSPADDVNAALPLYSGLHRVDGPVPITWDREAGLTIRQTEPLPMTVLSIVRTVTTNA